MAYEYNKCEDLTIGEEIQIANLKCSDLEFDARRGVQYPEDLPDCMFSTVRDFTVLWCNCTRSSMEILLPAGGILLV